MQLMRHSHVFWKSSDFPLEKTWFANPLLLSGLLSFFGALLLEAFLPVSPPLLGVHLFLMFSLELLQLFHWMGPDPVPEMHRGVELIIRSLARMAGRQHSKKHSQNTAVA